MDLVLKMMKTALCTALDATLRHWASWEEEAHNRQWSMVDTNWWLILPSSKAHLHSWKLGWQHGLLWLLRCELMKCQFQDWRMTDQYWNIMSLYCSIQCSLHWGIGVIFASLTDSRKGWLVSDTSCWKPFEFWVVYSYLAGLTICRQNKWKHALGSRESILKWGVSTTLSSVGLCRLFCSSPLAVSTCALLTEPHSLQRALQVSWKSFCSIFN